MNWKFESNDILVKPAEEGKGNKLARSGDNFQRTFAQIGRGMHSSPSMRESENVHRLKNLTKVAASNFKFTAVSCLLTIISTTNRERSVVISKFLNGNTDNAERGGAKGKTMMLLPPTLRSVVRSLLPPVRNLDKLTWGREPGNL